MYFLRFDVVLQLLTIRKVSQWLALLTVIVTITGRSLHIYLPVILWITVSTTYKPPRYCHYCQNNY
jgi:hypothetical protein